MSTPNDLALEALAYIEAETIAAATPAQKRRIANDLTAAMQQIHTDAPALYKDRHGARVAEPQSITVTVAQGATTLTTVSTLVDGSTIQIGGDPIFNTVRVDGATQTLTLPYNGLSGTYPATVWNDSLPIASTVDRIIGGVKLNEQFPLSPRRNRDDALASRLLEPDYGRRLRTVSNRQPGQPEAYWVEGILGTNGAATPLAQSRLRLHLYPLPNRSYTVGYDVRLKAPRFTSETIAAATDAALIVPADMVEAIVRPLFLKRWTGSPWFRNKEAKKEIDDQFKEALALLQSYRPQQQSRMRRTAPL